MSDDDALRHELNVALKAREELGADMEPEV